MRDAHTSIGAAANRIHLRSGARQTPSFVPSAQRAAAYALVNSYFHHDPLRAVCEGQLEFGMLASDIGYLRIKSFGRYSKVGTFASDTAELGAALDSIFARAASWKGFVIDVRLNGGGADPLGLIIAGRLTATATAYSKQARNDPTDPTEVDAAATQPGSRDVASRISRAGGRADRRSVRERSRDIHAGHAQSPAEGDESRGDHARRFLRRPRSATSECLDVWTP